MSSTLVVSVNAAVEKQKISILRAASSIIMQPFVFGGRKPCGLVGVGKRSGMIQELK
jgi:hypothetical protein